MSEAISTPQRQTAPGLRRNALWVVKILVALAFLAAGSAKLAGVQMMIDIFNTIGLGQWFRYVTGAIEVIGGILVLIPSLAAFGGLLLACTMVGAVITHLTVLPGSPSPALILFALNAAIAWLQRDQVVNLLQRAMPTATGKRHKYQQPIDMEMTMTTTNAETLVRRAYQLAEGNTLDVQGFVDLFAADGEINAGTMKFRGEQLGWLVMFLIKFAPDIHRELHRVVVQDNIVAVELAIRGTFTGPYESPAGVLPPNGAKLDVPGADFWLVENGKIKQFNCHVSVNILLEQMGVQADFASAIKAQAGAR